MQIRTTKVKATQAGSGHGGKLLHVTWLLEAWPNLVPVTDTPVIYVELTHEYFLHDTTEELDKQDVRINDYLNGESVRVIDAYIAEKNLIEKETRVDTASTNLTTVLETKYGTD